MAEAADATIRITVAYGAPEAVHLLEVTLPRGATVEEAIRASGILARCPGVDLCRDRVGIFNRLAALDDPVEDGDRVEIYRPLIADPKSARRHRAARQRK